MSIEGYPYILPKHPGDIMKNWFMKGRGMSAEDVSSATNIPIRTVQGVVDGKVAIDQPMALQLARVFGHAAETLYRLQVEYDHFKENGSILSYEELPTLRIPEPN